MDMAISPTVNPETEIDFYAGNDRTFRSLLPLWCELCMRERQGTFYVSRHVHNTNQDIDVTVLRPNQNFGGFAPLVLSSYKDLHDIYTNVDDRSFIIYEDEHIDQSQGLMLIVSLFLCKDQKALARRQSISDNVLLCTDEKSAANYLLSFLNGKPPQLIEAIDNHSVGMVYMAFGDKAKQHVNKSRMSLRSLGYAYPSIVVTEEEWQGESPFDLSQKRNFQFRAGRIKPFLYQYSPFEYNLYIDADTKFIKPIQEGFELLRDYDLVVTEEGLSLKELYNKRLAGWEINLNERDITINELKISELGPTEDRKFVNSGVFFFKQNKKTSKLFREWGKQWLRFQEWDEQLALMRAINLNPEVKVKYLPIEWNSPRLRDNIFIFHHYGAGDVRTTYENK